MFRRYRRGFGNRSRSNSLSFRTPDARCRCRGGFYTCSPREPPGPRPPRSWATSYGACTTETVGAPREGSVKRPGSPRCSTSTCGASRRPGNGWSSWDGLCSNPHLSRGSTAGGSRLRLTWIGRQCHNRSGSPKHHPQKGFPQPVYHPLERTKNSLRDLNTRNPPHADRRLVSARRQERRGDHHFAMFSP